MSRQSRFDAQYWILGAGALGRPRGMVWGGRREEGSGWGTHVYLWRIHFDIWKNQYNIVKLKNKIKLKQKEKETPIKKKIQFSSIAQSCPTLCNPMNHSTPGLAVHHQLPEFIQTHVHRVSDAIQPSHPLSSPSPLAHNPSQHHNLFQ